MSSFEIAKRIQEVLLDGKWIANTNFKELLEGVDIHLAQRKMGNHNTIEALYFHVGYYIEGILEAFEKGELIISDSKSFSFDKARTEEEWGRRKLQFVKNSHRFVEVVKTFTHEELEAPFFKAEYGSLQRNLEAQIEHSYYHLGQISLLLNLLKS